MENLTLDPKTHKYMLGDQIIPSVTQILKEMGFINFFGINENALKFGEVFHFWALLLDTDNIHLYKPDPLMGPWLNGLKKFNRDFKPKWKILEKPMSSRIWRFAGTPDRFGACLSDSTLADFKTGVDAKWHDIQTALYEVLIEENENIKVKDRISIYIKENDYSVEPHRNKINRTEGLSIVQAYHAKKQRGLIK